MDHQQEFALDLSLSGGSADRRPRQEHYTSHYRYTVPGRYDNVSDPGPSTSSRGTMPRSRNESRRAGKRSWRTLTPQEKIHAINRVHNGESKAAVARCIGVPESTLRGWCKAEKKILSQANSLKTSAVTLPGTYLAGFDHVLRSSSNNNNNSTVGGSSSRSTPTIQATGLPSTSGVTVRGEEFEAGPAHKRIKHETNSVGTRMANNIRAPIVHDSMYNPYNTVANTAANNTLFNENKRKHSASGFATSQPQDSTMDIPKPLRIQNQLPNVNKSSGSVSQNYETMPSTSSSDPVLQSKPNRNNKCLTSIIDGLRHPYEKSSSNSVTGVTFDAVNNDIDNETARKNYPDTLPPGCDEMVEYCAKLLEWLHHYGSPISTMKQVDCIQRILARLQDWIQKSKKELPKKTNGMS